MSPETPTPPSGPGESRSGGRFGGDGGWPRWTILVLLAVVVGAIGLQFIASSTPSNQISYGEFISDLNANDVKNATFDNANGHISGTLNDGSNFSTTGPIKPSDADQALFTEKGLKYSSPTESIWSTHYRS